MAIAAVIAFKLWLVHDEEIVGSATQYDALWYIRSASHWYWGTPYGWTAFIRPCAYPLWIALIHLLHLPLRLAIELLQIGGALVLIIALLKVGVSRAIALLSFVLIALHPAGFQLNDYSMSDTFYAGLLWYVLGGLLLTIVSRHWWVAALTGASIAILWNTREEGLLLVAIVLAWWTIFFLSETRRHQSRAIAFRTTVRPLIIVCLCALLGIVGVYSCNYAVFRSFARSEMNAPAFQGLFHSLLRIKPTEPKRYAPITMSTLSQAFVVSPTFTRLRPQFESPMGESWRVESFRRVGVQNEIGAGWIVWATRQCADAKGYFSTPTKAHKFFKKAAKEINLACDDGRLRTRFVIDGFLDPLAQSGGIAALPHSAKRVAARFVARWSITSIVDDEILTAEETALYNEMARRHSAGVGPRKGVAFAVEHFIGRYYFCLSIILHLVATLAVIFLLLNRGKGNAVSGCRDAILLLGCAVLLRAFLFAWLDATAFDGTEDRFLFPILTIWMVVLMLSVGWALEARQLAPNDP